MNILTKQSFDICIVGQGLAGTSLAWELHRRGCNIAIVDNQHAQSSSRVAAGLITPITGKRFVKSKQFDEQWRTATDFYRSIEKETGNTFISVNDAVRVFADENERNIFLETRKEEFSKITQVNDTPLDKEFFATCNGGFEMMQAGRLDVPKYLDASRDFFSNHQEVFKCEVDLKSDLRITENTIEIPKLGISSKKIIFCQGFSGVNNPWFESVPFDSAKGEILTVKIPGLLEKRVVYRGIWMVAICDEIYRVGATYDRENLDTMPTDAGQEELCSRLSEFLKLPFEVIDHEAGVRPIIVGRRPAIGFHPKQKQLGYFNGLGSKGSLQAPWFSKMFADHILNGSINPKEYDIARYLKSTN